MMSELTRRDFLRIGATGLAVASMGGLTLLSSKTAIAACLPAGPTRYGDYIACPDDYDSNREESFLLSIVGNAETIIDWGYGYTPFDGSWYYSQENVPTGKLHYMRAICGGIALQGPPLGVSGVDLSRLDTQVKRQKCPEVYIPVVPAPTSPDKPPGGGQINPKITLNRPNTRPTWSGITNMKTPIAVIAAQIVAYQLMDSDPRWKRDGKENEPYKRLLIQSAVAGQSRRPNADEVALDEVFNGRALAEFRFPNKNMTYQFFTEVLFDYGPMLPEYSLSRYRVSRSNMVQMDASGTMSTVRNPTNGERPRNP